LSPGVLLAWMRWRGAPWPTPCNGAMRSWSVALMLGGGMGGTAFAEQTVGSGLVVAFIAVMPLMIALLNLIWGVKPTRSKRGHRLRPGRRADADARQRLQASPAGLVAICIACAAGRWAAC
jgi:hypothetical protein